MSIRIILVRPTHAGNIGAAARAMKNMDLDELCLVAPEAIIDEQARARAAGAVDVLERSRIFPSLDESISDCRLVFGASARSRHIGAPVVSPRRCAELATAAMSQGPVAILFGQERSGLTNVELDRCHYLMQIPTGAEYPSLNVASAVQIVAYELLLASVGRADLPDSGGDSLPVDQEEMRRFYEHLEAVLQRVGFLDPENPRLLMRRLRRLYHRAQPDQNEMNILRGILTEISKKLDQLDNARGRSA